MLNDSFIESMLFFFQKNIMPDIYNSNTTVSKSSGMEPPIKKYIYHFSGPLHDVHPAHQMHPRGQMIWRHHFFLTLDDALVSQEHTVLFFENHLCFFIIRQIWSEDKCIVVGKDVDGNVLHMVLYIFKAIFIV